MRPLTLSLLFAGLLMPVTFARPQAVDTQQKTNEPARKDKAKTSQTYPVEALEIRLAENQLRAQTERMTLEDLLARAIKDNPDIRVAQSKLQEAEAELNRVKLQVTQKVVAQQREIAVLKAALHATQAELSRFQQLYKKGAVGQDMLQAAEAKLQQANAQLARLEAELPYILGTLPKALNETAIGEWREIIIQNGQRKHTSLTGGKTPAQKANKQETQAREQLLEKARIMDQIEHAIVVQQAKSARPSLPPAMADKLRKAFDTPVKMEFNKVGPKEILEFVQDHTGGFNLVDQAHIDKAAPIDLRLTEPVPVGAVFQLLEDQYGWRFVIREYGIVVTQAGRLPPGAVSLQAFWKDRPPQATTAPRRKIMDGG